MRVELKTRFLVSLLLACAATCVVSFPARAAGDEGDRTATIKAAFMYRFIQYVRWPEAETGAETEDETKDTDPFVIHILGESDLEGPLRKVAEKKKVGERDLVVRSSDTVESLEPCQMLLLAPSKAEQLEQDRAVGEAPGSAEDI